MQDLRQALGAIGAIRLQLAQAAQFRGLGPMTVGLSGVMAVLVGAAQAAWPAALAPNPLGFALTWMAAAALAGGVVAVEMASRSRRRHGPMATAMIHSVIERFAPAALAGLAATLALMRAAPDALWIAPGLWQLCMAVGLFASFRVLPAGCNAVAVWYFGTGVVALIAAGESRALEPWMMSAPFAVGQLAMALVLHAAERGADD